MTSKERAKLKSIASNMDTILQIGKNPIGGAFLKQVKDALKAREMIKIHVLETCELTPAETACALAEATGSETVQVIGSKVILFKRRPKDDKKGSYLDAEKTGADKTRSGAEKSRAEKIGASAPKGRGEKNGTKKNAVHKGGANGYRTGAVSARPFNKVGYGSKRTGKK